MSGEDPYVAGGVLVNKLGITSAAALSQAEADLTLVAILRLSVHPLPGDYDLEHLPEFHRQIFSAVYAWAGRIRTVDIAFFRQLARDAGWRIAWRDLDAAKNNQASSARFTATPNPWSGCSTAWSGRRRAPTG
ncbi:hypothetical protein ACQP2E_32435 [Actinoplanes sp. CA-015351]|uniref:hypothetical protein n=1 Tax=Actinoplanes sp. CA-015351 TaxID=3239897 RepID=UPI003D95D7B4